MSSRKTKKVPAKADASESRGSEEMSPAEEQQKITELRARLASMERNDCIAVILFVLFLIITFIIAFYFHDHRNWRFVKDN